MKIPLNSRYKTIYCNDGKSKGIYRYFACFQLVNGFSRYNVSGRQGTYTKWANLRQTCLAHLIRKAKGLAERKDPVASRFGKQIAADPQLLCHWAKKISRRSGMAQFLSSFHGFDF